MVLCFICGAAKASGTLALPGGASLLHGFVAVLLKGSKKVLCFEWKIQFLVAVPDHLIQRLEKYRRLGWVG